jgi:hypothetical protein
MLNPFVAVENLPRPQCALTRDDASRIEGFIASVRNPGPEIDELIFVVGFRHLMEAVRVVSIREVTKANNRGQEAIVAVG